MRWTLPYDILVLGAGHAGTEAAAIAARLCLRLGLTTRKLSTIYAVGRNSNFGGVGKRHFVTRGATPQASSPTTLGDTARALGQKPILSVIVMAMSPGWSRKACTPTSSIQQISPCPCLQKFSNMSSTLYLAWTARRSLHRAMLPNTTMSTHLSCSPT